MSATFDAKGTADATANGATSKDLTLLTITAGLTNSALVAQVGFSLQTVSAVSLKWDNAGTPQSMAQIVAANGTGTVARAELWGLIAPTSGNKTLHAAWTGASDVYLQAASWSGVDQSGGTTSFAHSTSATGTSSGIPGTHNTITITSAVNNATMDAVCCDAATYNSSTQTQTYLDNVATSISGGGSRAAGAATVTHAWTATGASDHWVSVGVDIVAASATTAATPAPTPRLIQTDRVLATGDGLPQAFAPRKVHVYPSPASFDFPVQNVPPLGQATPEVMRLKPFRAAPFLARVPPATSTVVTAAGVLSATGDATATFVGAAQDNSVLAAAGDATATFTGASKAAAVLSAAGDATATFTGSANAASVLSASADATASFTGAALDRGVLNAPGDSSLSFVGRADAAAVWNAAGDASAAWIGSTGGNVLSADGDSSAIFVGAELAAAVLAAAGDSSALWSGTFTVPGGDELGSRRPMRGRAKARKPPKQRRPIYRHPEEVERERRMLEEYLESLETKARPASEEPVRPGESQEAPTRRAEPVAPRLSDVMARLASAQQLALIVSAESAAKADKAKAKKEHQRRRVAAIAVLMMSH